MWLHNAPLSLPGPLSLFILLGPLASINLQVPCRSAHLHQNLCLYKMMIKVPTLASHEFYEIAAISSS